MFFISSFLERVGLQGHFATKLYQNLTVIERSVLNKKISNIVLTNFAIIVATSSNQYFVSYSSFTIFSGFHLVVLLHDVIASWKERELSKRLTTWYKY